MSIERLERKNGHVYKVAWREGNTQRRKTFKLKRDAEAWEAKTKLAKRAGLLDSLDAGTETFEAFYADWWVLYAERQLAPRTRDYYSRTVKKYILPVFGKQQLRQINALDVQKFAHEMEVNGAGRETVRKSLAILQGIFRRACEWGRMPANPVQYTSKPKAQRKASIRVFSPADVESILGRVDLSPAYGTLIRLIAYAGLRPAEALALDWADIRSGHLLIFRSNVRGAYAPTKTGSRRRVNLLRPLEADLRKYRLARGRPETGPVVGGGRASSTGLWTDSQYRNFRRRVWRDLPGVGGARLYDLRHSFASLLFAEHANPVYVAEQLGHSPAVLLSTYLHVIEELNDQPRQSAEEAIWAARANPRRELVSQAALEEAIGLCYPEARSNI